MFRVLTIIDNPTHKRTLFPILQKIGAKVIDCQRKYSTFLRLVQYVPHVIIIESTNLSMEDLRLVQLIKKNKDGASIPLLFIGPKLTSEKQETIETYGIKEYYSTPLDLKKLIIAVKTIEKVGSERVKAELGIDKNQLSKQEERIVLNKRELLSRKLDIIERHVHKLLAFPTTVVQLIKRSEDGQSGAADLGRIVESDSAVAAEVLKLANSVHFATSGKRTTSLRDAIVRIGLEQTKSIVVSMTVMKSFTDDNYQTGFNHQQYWSHSLSVAIITGMIAKQSNIVKSDEAFVFGLLHELGVFLYNEYLNKFFLMLLDKSSEMGFPFNFFQQELLAMTHNDLMGRLCDKWNFPSNFVENFKALDKDPLSTEALASTPLATIAMVADSIAHSLCLGRGADCCVHVLPMELMSSLKLYHFLNDTTFEKIFSAFNLYNMVLNLGQRDFHAIEPLMLENDQIPVVLLEPTDGAWSPLYTYLHKQGYAIEQVGNEEQLFACMEKDENGIFILTHFAEAHKGLLERCKLYSYRGIVFDDKEMVSESYNSYGIVVTNYPVDLRNIDMVLHAIHMNLFEQDMTGRIGTLLPVGESHVNSPRVLLVHPDPAVIGAMEEHLASAGIHIVESVLDGDKAINIAQTSQKDLDYIFVGLESTVVDALDIVLEIKRQTRHKRAKYILMIRGKRPDFIVLEKFAQAGVVRLIFLDEKGIQNNIRKILGKSILTDLDE